VVEAAFAVDRRSRDSSASQRIEAVLARRGRADMWVVRPREGDDGIGHMRSHLNVLLFRMIVGSSRRRLANRSPEVPPWMRLASRQRHLEGGLGKRL
jgi:hypothetical protein